MEESAILIVREQANTKSRHGLESALQSQEWVCQSLEENTLPIVGVDVDLICQLESSY